MYSYLHLKILLLSKSYTLHLQICPILKTNIPHIPLLKDRSKIEHFKRESPSRSVVSDSFGTHDYTVHGILQARIVA